MITQSFRHTILFTLLSIATSTFAQTSRKPYSINTNPLSHYSVKWNNPEYKACNTTSNSLYMTKAERDVIYILNLLHSNPALFAKTVLAAYPDSSDRPWLKNKAEYKSLMDTLLKIQPITIMKPDKKCFTSAECQASSTGITGFVGHERQNKDCEKKTCFNGECIAYGNSGALDIVMQLLIDEGVPSLGHRMICLTGYPQLGVAIRSHKLYGYDAVLDFHWESNGKW